MKQFKAMMKRILRCQHYLALSFALVMLQPGPVMARVLLGLILLASVSPVVARIVVRKPVGSDHYRSAGWPLQVKEEHEPSALGAGVHQPAHQPAHQQVQSFTGLWLTELLDVVPHHKLDAQIIWSERLLPVQSFTGPWLTELLDFVPRHELDLRN